MIRRFRHRGLRRLYEDDDRRELNPQHADKIARMLARLDQATRPDQLDLPGFRLHPLKGELAGYWSITVSANWRIIFRFEQGDATDVDLIEALVGFRGDGAHHLTRAAIRAPSRAFPRRRALCTNSKGTVARLGVRRRSGISALVL